MIELKNEIMPIGSRVLIRLMGDNPYLNMETPTGLKMTNGKFENPDSGEMDQKDTPIRCAEVIDVGPDCKFIRPDDHIYVNINSLIPVPFRGEVLFCVSEANIIIMLGNDLKSRKYD